MDSTKALGFGSVKRRPVHRPGVYDDETFGGNLTFERFMDVMEGNPRDGDLVG